MEPMYKKHILVKPQLYKRFQEYNAEAIEQAKVYNCFVDEVKNLSDDRGLENAIIYLQEKYGYE